MRRCLTLSLLGLGLLAGPADAATRYASPTGTGIACTEPAPCTLRDAMDQAQTAAAPTPPEADNLVKLLPGTYAPGGGLPAVRGFALQGATLGAAARPVVTLVETLQVQAGGTVRDVELVGGGSLSGPVVSALGSTGQPAQVRQVIARSTTGDACAINAISFLQNALCVTDGPSASGIRASGDALIRNVTAISSDAAGVLLENTATATVLGIVAEGDTFGIANRSGAATLKCDATSPEMGDVAPATFEPNAGYRLAARSAADSCAASDLTPPYVAGDLDLDGNLRRIGTEIEPGAYERVPAAPIATPAPATGVTTVAAKMNASLDTGGGFTTYRFDWGTDADFQTAPQGGYSSSTRSGLMTGATGDAAVQVPLTGLLSGTTYHYRIVATNFRGTTEGPDTTFTTAVAPPVDGGTGTGTGGGGGAGGAVTPAPSPGVILDVTPVPISPADPGATLTLKPSLRLDDPAKVAARRLLAGRTVRLRVRCGGPSCRVTGGGELRRRKGKRLGRLTAPKRALQVGQGGKGSIGVLVAPKLRRAAKGQLKAGRTVTLRLTATFVDPSGTTITKTLQVAVAPARR